MPMHFGRVFTAVLISTLLLGCVSLSKKQNPYESASPAEIALFPKVHLPFEAGTNFVVSQGAFGTDSHSEPGNEYSWDFDVPVGTYVTSVADGEVIDIWEPRKGGGCDPSFSDSAQNMKVKHWDGTVAQYVHIESLVTKGNLVKAGQRIAKTAMNGFICKPQLHFGVYKSEEHLYFSDKRQTIPVLFIEIPGGLARRGFMGRAN